MILMMLCGACVAEGIDYASLSDDELHLVISKARNELAKRELNAEKDAVLFEQDGVTVYLTGKDSFEEDKYDLEYAPLKIGVILINDSDRNIGVNLKNPAVNGWDVSSSLAPSVSANKKAKGVIELNVFDAEITSLDDLEELEVSFELYDTDSYDTFAEVGPVTLHFNAEQ